MTINYKNISLCILGLIVTGQTANASAIDVYMGGLVGGGADMTFTSDEHDTASSMAFGGVIGLDIPLIRLEAEYNHINSDNINTNQAMLNAYFKMLSTLIHPYLGIGVGTIFGGHGTNSMSIETTAAYQGMLGLTFDILAVPLKFDIEGRALYAPDIYDINHSPDLFHYDARIKIRYVF